MSALARFLVHDVEDRTDPHVCRTEADVRAAIADLDGQPFQVLTIAIDEFCRDVTAEFLPDESEDEPEYPTFDRACSAADRTHQARKEAF